MNYHNELYDDNGDSTSSEYETDSSCSDMSCSSIESFSGDLTQLRTIVASLNATIETLETHLISIQRPIELLHLDQLGDIPFLQSSPFRHNELKFKSHVGIPGIDTKKRYTFAEIMAIVRDYLFTNNAVQEDGSIKLTKEMKKVIGIKESNVSYIDIMNHMRQIVH